MITSKLKSITRNFINRHFINRVNQMDEISLKPISDVFGLDRGKPIDRYYIEKFLQMNRSLIKGNCLEVGDDNYTKKYGNQDCLSFILKPPSLTSHNKKHNKLLKNELHYNLSENRVKPVKRFDTIICTQTLNFIEFPDKSINSLFDLLNPDGNLILTVSGISQISNYDYDRWGDFWRFTDLSIMKLLCKKFNKKNIKLTTFGNVATSCMFLQGLSTQDIKEKKVLDFVDKNYQLLI